MRRFGPAACGALVGLLALSAPAMAQHARPEPLILAPEPGDRVEAGSVVVAVSFLDPDGRLDPFSVTLELNGRSVTHEAVVGDHTVRWRPTQPLPPGLHRVVLRAADVDGRPIPAADWAFSVARTVDAGADPGLPGEPRSAADRWVPGRGSVTIETTGQAMTGPGSAFRREESFVPRLWANSAGDLGNGWRYSARVHLSGYESSGRQPVNRFVVDVRSERFQASLGDVTPVFHELILAGRRVRGVEADLRGGPARISAVWGESRRAVEGLLDPADPMRILRPGTYGQSLIAVRPSLHRGDRVQAGMTFLRARDDVGSIAEFRVPIPGVEEGNTRSVNPLPKDNAVVGGDVSARFLGGQVSVQYENAVSLLANDISTGALSEAEMDSIFLAARHGTPGVDPQRFRRLFTLNSSVIPLDPKGLSSVAHQVRSTVRAGGHLVTAEWRSIGGSYHTMGHPSLLRDRRGIRLRDSFLALDDALALTAGVERDRDNLDGVKQATTTHTGVFADATWIPSRDRLTVTASMRYGTRRNSHPRGVDGALDEVNRALSLSVTHPVTLPGGIRSAATLNVAVVDRNDEANAVVGARNHFYMAGLRGESPDRATSFAGNYGFTRSEFTGFAGARTSFHMARGHLRHRLSAAWAGGLDGALTLARSPDRAAELGLHYDRAELLAGAEWEWEPGAAVSFTLGVSSYADELDAGRNTREVLSRVRVTRGF